MTISLAGVATRRWPNSLFMSYGNTFSLFCHNASFSRACVSPFECTKSDVVGAPRRRRKRNPAQAMRMAAPKIPPTIPPIADEDSP